jgi:hypothetical protein
MNGPNYLIYSTSNLTLVDGNMLNRRKQLELLHSCPNLEHMGWLAYIQRDRFPCYDFEMFLEPEDSSHHLRNFELLQGNMMDI